MTDIVAKYQNISKHIKILFDKHCWKLSKHIETYQNIVWQILLQNIKTYRNISKHYLIKVVVKYQNISKLIKTLFDKYCCKISRHIETYKTFFDKSGCEISKYIDILLIKINIHCSLHTWPVSEKIKARHCCKCVQRIEHGKESKDEIFAKHSFLKIILRKSNITWNIFFAFLSMFDGLAAL